MLRNPYGLALVAYYAVMAVVGMLIPEDILRSHAWAREFSDFMASIVPQIDRITALNIKPDVNRFYFSVLWAGSPVLLVLCSLLVWYGRILGYPMWTTPLRTALSSMTVLLVAIFWTQNLWFVEPSMGLSNILFGNVFGRSLYGQIVFHTGAVFLGSGLFIWILGWITGYIPRNIKKHQNPPLL